MKYFFLIFLFLTSNFINAQIILTRNNFPAGGDTIYQFYLEDVPDIFGPSGSGAVWDFSDVIIPEKNYLITYYNLPDGNLQSHKHSEDFWIYDYYWTYNVSTNKIEVVRYGYSYFGDFTGQGSQSFMGGLTKMEFPFTFNSLFTDTAYYNSSGSSYTHAGFESYDNYGFAIDTIICDGTGQIRLPFGIYSAVRIHTIHFQIDSTDFGAVSHSSEEYTWYTEQTKGPVISAFKEDNSNWAWSLYSNLADPKQQQTAHDTASSMICYYGSKPWMYQLVIKNIFTSDFQMLIYDIQGKIIQNKKLKISSSSEKFPIDLASCEDGIYFLKIQDGNYFKTFKLYKGH